MNNNLFCKLKHFWGTELLLDDGKVLHIPKDGLCLNVPKEVERLLLENKACWEAREPPKPPKKEIVFPEIKPRRQPVVEAPKPEPVIEVPKVVIPDPVAPPPQEAPLVPPVELPKVEEPPVPDQASASSQEPATEETEQVPF